MSVQASAVLKNFDLVIGGEVVIREAATILQIGARGTTALKTNTLMAQIAATGKWAPFTDETATDGTAIAKGIYIGADIAGADLVAGDVVDCPIITGGLGCLVDAQMLVIENAKTLDTVVGAGTVNARRVEDDLNRIGIFVEGTTDIDRLEN